MASGFALAPIPKWYFADNFGRPLGAGKMYTFSNLNKNLHKPVFQDPNGVFPWTNPILFNLNGEQGPFYWAFNTLLPDDTYYLEVYDKDDVLQFTVENYFPPGGGGGGGGSTLVTTTNLISNNIFLNNIGSITPAGTSNTVIAPGPHFGFNPGMTDFRFIKTSSLAATDQLSFENFALNDDPFVADVTPVQYLRYHCTVAGTETEKILQIPITSKVANLDNQTLLFSFWGRSLPGPVNIELFQYQFFGNGGGSVVPPVSVQIFSLTDQWVRRTASIAVPNLGSNTLGACGDDGYFLQIQFPLSSTSQIDIAKPCLYLGNVDPGKDFLTNDQTIAQIDGPRTGDMRVSINNFAPYGWVIMNDGTIGSATSGATTRANIDTFPLFKTIWQQVGATNAPMFTNIGAPVAYGTDPETDFAANRRLSLTKTLGRALAGIGTPSSGGTNWALGQTFGQEQHALSTPEMPAHNHAGSTFQLEHFSNVGGPGPFNAYGTPGPGGITDTLNVTVAFNGGTVPGGAGPSLPFSLISPTVHYRIFMKL